MAIIEDSAGGNGVIERKAIRSSRDGGRHRKKIVRWRQATQQTAAKMASNKTQRRASISARNISSALSAKGVAASANSGADGIWRKNSREK